MGWLRRPPHRGLLSLFEAICGVRAQMEKKEVITASLDKTMALWRLEVRCQLSFKCTQGYFPSSAKQRSALVPMVPCQALPLPARLAVFKRSRGSSSSLHDLPAFRHKYYVCLYQRHTHTVVLVNRLGLVQAVEEGGEVLGVRPQEVARLNPAGAPIFSLAVDVSALDLSADSLDTRQQASHTPCARAPGWRVCVLAGSGGALLLVLCAAVTYGPGDLQEGTSFTSRLQEVTS